MEIFRCYSDLHLKCLQHPISKVSETAKDVCEWITNYFARMLPLNPRENEEFENWLSQYIGDINGHSGVPYSHLFTLPVNTPILCHRY